MLERAGFRLSCLGLSCIGAALLATTLAASAGPAGGGGFGPALGAGRSGSAPLAAGGAVGRMAGGRIAGHRNFARHSGGPYRLRNVAGWPGYFDPGFGGGSAVVVLGLTQEAAEQPEPGIPVVVGIRRPPEASPVLYRIEAGKGRGAPRVIRLDADGASVTTGARIVPVKVR